MITKIFHPNVSKAGEICVDTLKKGWKKEYGVGHVLVVRLPSRIADRTGLHTNTGKGRVGTASWR